MTFERQKTFEKMTKMFAKMFMSFRKVKDLWSNLIIVCLWRNWGKDKFIRKHFQRQIRKERNAKNDQIKKGWNRALKKNLDRDELEIKENKKIYKI